ncbi:MAG TPA: 16S rRNA (cytosine(1402)-N(4))-methyltransferase, partial [Vulgatibacter sp.]|nr:16S rRNA (cytosine(1402)-N(4))-methyltransferase [Vulgatibacter sp.]
MSRDHVTVLAREAVEILEPGPGRRVLDGTLGYGGHSERLLEAGADVIGVDRD